jgi:hypothetical protein
MLRIEPCFGQGGPPQAVSWHLGAFHMAMLHAPCWHASMPPSCQCLVLVGGPSRSTRRRSIVFVGVIVFLQNQVLVPFQHSTPYSVAAILQETMPHMIGLRHLDCCPLSIRGFSRLEPVLFLENWTSGCCADSATPAEYGYATSSHPDTVLRTLLRPFFLTTLFIVGAHRLCRHLLFGAPSRCGFFT